MRESCAIKVMCLDEGRAQGADLDRALEAVLPRLDLVDSCARLGNQFLGCAGIAKALQVRGKPTLVELATFHLRLHGCSRGRCGAILRPHRFNAAAKSGHLLQGLM